MRGLPVTGAVSGDRPRDLREMPRCRIGKIDPVLLGGGKRIFRDGGMLRTLRLVDGQVASTGAILATYAPAA
jgi:hypothetical protein